MLHNSPTLSYLPAIRPNPWAKPALVSGIILLLGSLVPICGLAVVPLACVSVAVGLTGIGFATWGRRGRLVMSIFGTILSLAAVFLPMAMLGTVPFLLKLGFKLSNPPPAAPMTAPASTQASGQPTTSASG